MLEFLSGNMKIQTDKENYRLGDKVEAVFTLELKSFVKAKGVVARLWAYREVSRSGYSGGKRTHHTERVTLFSKETSLEGEGEFNGKKEYKASFDIPQDGALVSQPGLLGFIGGSIVHWELSAKLDLPMAIDIGATKKLNVGN